MTAPKFAMLALALTACTSTVPDSGVGFGDYSEYVRDREAARATPIVPPGPVFSTERVGAALDASDNGQTAATSPTYASPTAAGQTGRVIGQTAAADRPRGNAPAGIRTENGEVRSGGSISDEQDFGAVSARETIQSDAERIAQNRAQYQVIQPTAVPQRSGAGGPNIVEYALATTHNPGTQLYKRSSFFAKDPLVACAKYTAPGLAQEWFLANGGPERDKAGIDPDGDGFACGWDPRPFRAAKR